jgi:uncharacterized surface protein with fasciclin (FAS1) repeats
MTAKARFPDPYRSRAVLIGAAAYRDPSLPKLPAVARNLTGLTAVLTDPGGGGWRADRVTVLRNPITAREVGLELASVAEQTLDTLLIYYAGHGLLTPEGELHLAIGQTVPGRVRYSGLPFEWVREALRDSPAANRVLILDCCFSGRVIEAMADPAAFTADATEVTGTYTLTASARNLPALAPSGQTYTAFTGELLDLLTTGIPHGPAELTLGVIYPHLRQRLSARGLPRPQQRGTDTADQLALVRNPAYTRTDTAAQVPDGESRRPAPPSIDTERLANSDHQQLWSWWWPLRREAVKRRRELTAAMASVAIGGAAIAVWSVQTPLPSPGIAPASRPATPSFEAVAPSGTGVTKERPGSAQGMVNDPVATAASNNPLLTTLVKAVTAANLGDTLNSAPGITVFAPADPAFQALEVQHPGILKELTTAPDVASPNSKLTKILTYHLVGQRYDSAGIVQAGTLDSLEGAKIKIGGTPAAPTVNGAPVLCGNIPTKNATVFMIEQVLSLPAS